MPILMTDDSSQNAGRPPGEGGYRSRKGEGEEVDPGHPPALIVPKDL